MIVLGNADFALGMKFSGVEKSHIVKTREDVLKALKEVDRDEFILANVSVIEMVPELGDYKNVVSIPDNASEFKSIDDLKHIIKSAIGIELEM